MLQAQHQLPTSAPVELHQGLDTDEEDVHMMGMSPVMDFVHLPWGSPGGGTSLQVPAVSFAMGIGAHQ